MKVKMEIPDHEVKAVLRAQLAQHGFEVADEDISFKKRSVIIMIEASLAAAFPAMVSPPAVNATATTAEPAPSQYLADPSPAPLAPPPKETTLQVVEDGNNPDDMSDVLGASARITRAGGGKFPVPERQLMEGESLDFPADK